MRKRLPLLLAVVVCAAAVGVSVPWWSEVWEWVTHKEKQHLVVRYANVELSVYMRVNRLTSMPDGPTTFFWPNGLEERQGKYRRGEPVGVWTWWHQDGTVNFQVRYVDGRSHESRHSPPWWPDYRGNPVTDQVVGDE